MSWRDRAACVGADPELFVAPHSGEMTAATRQRVTDALLYCRDCPVIDQCGQEADDNGDEGVRGGIVRIKGQYVPVSMLGRGRRVPECGTAAAYRRHLRLGEHIDLKCRNAWAAHQREVRAAARS